MFKPVRILFGAAERGIQSVSSTHPILHPFKYRQRKSFSVNQSLRESIDTPFPKQFKFKNVLIVTKLSRYEFEQHKNPKLTVPELEKMLRDRGTDYELLLHYHRIHKEFEQRMAKSFKEFGIDVELPVLRSI